MACGWVPVVGAGCDAVDPGCSAVNKDAVGSGLGGRLCSACGRIFGGINNRPEHPQVGAAERELLVADMGAGQLSAGRFRVIRPRVGKRFVAAMK